MKRLADPTETPMTFEAFDEVLAECGDLYRRLIDLRGGCRCFIAPPCRACCEPMTESEARSIGWLPLGAAQPEAQITDSDRAGIETEPVRTEPTPAPTFYQYRDTSNLLKVWPIGRGQGGAL